MPKSGFTVKSYRRRRSKKKTRAKPYPAIPAIPELPEPEWITKIKPTAPDSDYKYGKITIERMITYPWKVRSQYDLDQEYFKVIKNFRNMKGADLEYFDYMDRVYLNLRNNEERYNCIEKLKKYTVITPYQVVEESQDEDGIAEDDSETESEDDLWDENEGTSDNPISLC